MSEYTATASLEPLVRELTEGETTPSAHLETVRSRVETVESTIRAFVSEPNRWERTERAAVDRETDTNGDASSRLTIQSPLHGVPVGVKDILHVDGLKTRAGATLPPAVLGGTEASVVGTLREAGAIVLGKTVTTEFAYFAPGPTRNPQGLDHTPGGSSSGSAAAVAAGLCPLALGTQTIGSVIRPAAFCGIVGLKPSYGRIPVDGIVPVAPSVDHVGLFTQRLPGATLAAGLLIPDWCPVEPPELGRVGVVAGAYLEQASDRGQEEFRDQTRQLTAGGVQTVAVEPIPDIAGINGRHKRLTAAEAALSHDEWFLAYEDQYADETAELIQTGHQVSVEELVAARGGRHELRERLHTEMDRLNLDVIVTPAAPGPAPEGLSHTGDPVMNLPWTHAGVPTVTIPASRGDDGLPFGLQCVARYGQDEQLMSWTQTLAEALESAPSAT